MLIDFKELKPLNISKVSNAEKYKYKIGECYYHAYHLY